MLSSTLFIAFYVISGKNIVDLVAYVFEKKMVQTLVHYDLPNLYIVCETYLITKCDFLARYFHKNYHYFLHQNDIKSDFFGVLIYSCLR